MQSERFEDKFIHDLRDRVSIVDVASRHVQWDKRKSVPARGDYWACCPFHDEKSASFHVREGEGYFKCFGCGAGGDVIELIMHLERLSFPAAVRKLGGLDDKPQERRFAPRRAVAPEMPDPDKLAAALMLWDQAVPISCTLAETYLRSRGIGADLTQADLRFHPNAPYKAYAPSRGVRMPAMIAAIRNVHGDIIGTHATYLAPDGLSKADVDPARKVFGKKEGGFIRLAPLYGRIVVGEGIESALSAGEVSGRPPLSTVTSENMAKLPLIPGVSDYLVAYDRDPKQQGLIKARELAKRLLAAGVTLCGFPPPLDCKDWNDASQRRRA